MKFVILGAGTAGLISALVLKEAYPTSLIHVIKSGEIGIVGVGEGSTEHWNLFMEYVGIDFKELLCETDATVKIGILFKDWNLGTIYAHSVAPTRISRENRPDALSLLYLRNIDRKMPVTPEFEEIYFKNQVRLTPDLRCTNQYHFDTFKLNEYLTKKAEQRGIKFSDRVIDDIIQDEHGVVTHLCSNGEKIPGDFFIDCSGFKRVISTKLGCEWVSCTKHLPMNHAIAFPTEFNNEQDIEPYTTSTALSSGWSWKIPTQKRYGNGYVFNDSYITADQALGEISKSIGKDIEKVGRDIKFNAGRVDQFWVKNVINIGLSSSFTEPLEAQSIGFTIIQIRMLTYFLDMWKLDPTVSKIYNEKMVSGFNNLIDYLQLHYLGTRNDSAFWKDRPFELTDFLKENLELFRHNIFDRVGMNSSEFYHMFKIPNFFQVAAGLNIIDRKHVKRYLETLTSSHQEETNNSIRNTYNDLSKAYTIKHKIYLDIIRHNYERTI